MARLPAVSGKDTIKALQKAGFTVKRVKGSHHALTKDDMLVTVPVHGNADLAKKTLKSILKGARLSVEQFLELVR